MQSKGFTHGSIHGATYTRLRPKYTWLASPFSPRPGAPIPDPLPLPGPSGRMSFFDWLMHNRWGENPISDLARDIAIETDRNPTFFSRLSESWDEIKDFLPSHADPEVHAALRYAWNDYVKFVTGPAYKTHGEDMRRG